MSNKEPPLFTIEFTYSAEEEDKIVDWLLENNYEIVHMGELESEDDELDDDDDDDEGVALHPVIPAEIVFPSMQSRSYVGLKKPSEIVEYLDRYVVGQEEAKKTVAVALTNHAFRVIYNKDERKLSPHEPDRIRKSNVLLIGDSGCGKSYIAELAARYLGKPFVSVDVTKFSATGFVGGNVEEIVDLLMVAAGGNGDLAEEGVIFLDEFDKLAPSASGNEDVNTTQVQYALLKMIEGMDFSVQSTQSFNKKITLNTTDVLFVLAGAFGGMSGKKKSKTDEKYFGFNKNHENSREDSDISEEDILKYGIIPEILGRIGTFVQLSELTDDELRKILLDVDASPIKQAKQLYKIRFPDKTFPLTQEDYDDIIKIARKSKLGARGLAREVTKRMQKYYYE